MIYHFQASGHTLLEYAKAEGKLITDIEIDKSFAELLKDNLKNMSSVEAIIIDRYALPDTDQEFENGISMLKDIGFDARLLVIVDNSENEVITVYEDYVMLNKAIRNLDTEIKVFIRGEKLKEESKSVWIGVASARAGAGSTTLAMQLTTSLAELEPKTCYIEADGSHNLREIAAWYDFAEAEQGYSDGRASYQSNTIDAEMLYNIIDLGHLTARKMQLLNQCQVKIIVADAKPYGLSKLNNVLSTRDDINGQLHVVLNFSSESEQERIFDSLPGDIKVYFNGYNPDFFSVSNKAVLKRILSNIIDIPDDEMDEKTGKGIVSYDITGMLKLQRNRIAIAAMVVVTIGALLLLLSGDKNKNLAAEDTRMTSASAEMITSTEPMSSEMSTTDTSVSSEIATVIPTDTQATIEPSSDTTMTTEALEESTTEVMTDEASTETFTDTSTETPSVEPTTETPTETTSEASTEATTETPTEISLPDVSFYDGDVWAGSQVKECITLYGAYYKIVVKNRDGNTGKYGKAGESSLDFIQDSVQYVAKLSKKKGVVVKITFTQV